MYGREIVMPIKELCINTYTYGTVSYSTKWQQVTLSNITSYIRDLVLIVIVVWLLYGPLDNSQLPIPP